FRLDAHVGERALGDRAHVERALLEAAADLVWRVGDWPAHLPAQFFAEFVGVGGALGDHPAHGGAAFADRHLPPLALRGGGALERRVDFAGARERPLGVHRAVNRRDGSLYLWAHGPILVRRLVRPQ